MLRRPPISTLFPYHDALPICLGDHACRRAADAGLLAGSADPGLSGRGGGPLRDRKSTRLNSSHQIISYAVFCLKKKKNKRARATTLLDTSITPGDSPTSLVPS